MSLVRKLNSSSTTGLRSPDENVANQNTMLSEQKVTKDLKANDLDDKKQPQKELDTRCVQTVSSA